MASAEYPPTSRTAVDPESVAKADNCRIAYIFSAPLIRRTSAGKLSDVEPLNVTKERMHLQRCLVSSGKQVTWSQCAATISNFRNAITVGCRVLHFTGHGMPGHVTFEDDHGEMFLLNAEGLRELFEVGGGAEGVKFVFVSACHSQDVGQAFVEAGVPHVVAVRTSDAILDDASLIFSHQFYTALLNGHSVAKSFNIARMAVKYDPRISQGHKNEQEKFLLLGNGDHERDTIFADAPVGPFKNATPPIRNRCDAVSDCFQGRAREVHKIIKMLDVSRCITLTGVYGIGKTQVALRVADFAAERHKFADIFTVHLTQPETGTLGLMQQFAAALKVPNGPAEKFYASVNSKYSGKDGSRFLAIVDGCEGHLQLGEPVLPAFLSHLAGRAGGIHFLLTSVQAVGYMSNLSEKPCPIGPLAPSEAAALFLHKAPRKLKFTEMGLAPGCRLGYKGVWAALARTPVLKALDGHPGAICKVVTRLAATNPRDGQPYNLTLHQDEFTRIIIPNVLRKYRANSARVLFNSIPTGVPSAPGLHHTSSAPNRHRSNTVAGGAAPDAAANMGPEAMATLRRLLPNFATAEVWRAAHLSAARALASVSLPPSIAEAKGPADLPRVPSLYPATSADSVASLPDCDYVEASGAGFGAGTADNNESEADVRASMPPGPPGGSSLLAAARAAMPPGPPGAGGAVSHFVSRPTPPAPALKHAMSVPGPGHTTPAPPVINIDVSKPLKWGPIAEQLQRKFSEVAPVAAHGRPLEPSDLEFIASSPKLSPVRNGEVTVERFRKWWPKMSGWLHSMHRMEHLWIQKDPCLILGWLNRDQANARLGACSEGTFLFRFSEGAPGVLALCMVKGTHCQHVLVHVLDTGFELMTGAHSSIVFKSLGELVLRYRDLHTLYPNVPKASAFRV